MQYKVVYHNDNNASVTLDDVEICKMIRQENYLWYLYAVKDGVQLAPHIDKDQYRHDLVERLECGNYRQKIAKLVGKELPADDIKQDLSLDFIGKDCELRVFHHCLIVDSKPAVVEVPLAEYIVEIKDDSLVTESDGVRSITPLSEVQFTWA